MIAIIDYGAGNVASVANAVKKLGYDYLLTSEISQLDEADKIILPGVGEASFAMAELIKRNLTGFIKENKKPLLGICLGMQLLLDYSEEGETKELGIIPGTIRRFDSKITKVPHIGWNTVSHNNENVLFKGIDQDEFFYFANSYYAPLGDFTTSYSENGIKFSASLEKENFYGVQFHPEKSSSAGLLLLKNFIERC